MGQPEVMTRVLDHDLTAAKRIDLATSQSMRPPMAYKVAMLHRHLMTAALPACSISCAK